MRGAGRRAEIARELVGAARSHEAGLVGDDHELHPVAGEQLRHDPRDVRLGRQRAQEELVPDLVVVEALTHQRQHLALAVGEGLQPRDFAATRASRSQGEAGFQALLTMLSEFRADEVWGQAVVQQLKVVRDPRAIEPLMECFSSPVYEVANAAPGPCDASARTPFPR